MSESEGRAARIAEIRARLQMWEMSPQHPNAVYPGRDAPRDVSWLLSVVEELQKDRRICSVCWTSSQVPVPTEAECDWQHPHEGEHSRCDMCWQHEALVALRARVAALEEAIRKAIDDATRMAVERKPFPTFWLANLRFVLSAGAVPTGEEKR